MGAELQLFAFGRFRIQKDGQPLAGLVSAKAQALLIYLAVTGKTCSRPALAGLLWGDMPEETARANLRLTLTKLRKAIGEHLSITWESVAFNTDRPYSLDVADFLTHTRHPERTSLQQLRPALDLYQGDFLEDFYIRDAPDFEGWAAGERERLRQAAIKAWWHLGAQAREHNDVESGLEAARHVLALEPWSEEAHQQLMWGLDRAGQWSAALAQFEVCRHTLAEELGVEPSSATLTLYEQIKHNRANALTSVQRPTTAPSEPTYSLIAEPAPHPGPPVSQHNLPAPLTPFIGRETESAQIVERLADSACRLLTLIGPGGIGKTRLALAAGEAAARSLGIGIYFVSFAGVIPTEPGEAIEMLVEGIGNALHHTFSTQQPPRDSLSNHLADKALLLVLDNLETLRPANKLLADLLRQAPRVKMLATSRERLGVAGEWLLEVNGLPFASAATEYASGVYPAVQLFVQGARRLRPDFDPTSEAVAINRICQLVEGSPLGIELAARWVRVLACADIVTRLERGLDLLSAHDSPTTDRHHNLRVVLADSWQALTEDERRIFRRLSVFQGGFDLAAAEQVAEATLPVLAGLMDKSWLRREATGRYHIHELLRQYGAEQFANQPHEQTRVREKHSDYFSAFLRARQASLDEYADPSVLADVAEHAEVDNIRTAVEWRLEQKSVDALVVFLNGLWSYYRHKGWLQEAISTLERATRREDAPADRRARWHLWLGEAHYQMGRRAESEEHLARALELFGRPLPKTEVEWGTRLLRELIRQSAHRLWTPALAKREADQIERWLDAAWAFHHLGPLYYQAGDGLASLTAAFCDLNLAERANAAPELARAYAGCCITLGSIPVHPLAARYGERAIATAQASGDLAAQAYALEIVALYRSGLGDWAEAEAMLEEAVARYAQLGQPRGEIEGRSILAKVKYFRGEFAHAQQHYAQALTISQRHGDIAGEHWSLLGLIECDLHTREATTAEIAGWLKRSEWLQTNYALAPADVVRFYGAATLTQLQWGDHQQALEMAQVGARLLKRNKLAGSWTMDGFAGLAEAYLTLWEMKPNDPNSPTLAVSASEACQALWTFARLFPIARPRAWLSQGWLAWLKGQPARAQRAWRKSLSQAEQLAMPYEQARAHAELGRHLPAQDGQRAAHLRQAEGLFAKLNADADRKRIARMLAGADG